MPLDTSRRSFLIRAGSFVACAPAIVAAASLMPVKAAYTGRFEPLPFVDLSPGAVNYGPDFVFHQGRYWTADGHAVHSSAPVDHMCTFGTVAIFTPAPT